MSSRLEGLAIFGLTAALLPVKVVFGLFEATFCLLSIEVVFGLALAKPLEALVVFDSAELDGETVVAVSANLLAEETVVAALTEGSIGAALVKEAVGASPSCFCTRLSGSGASKRCSII